jgi:predicted DNA-binding transcriptional regulator YafY
MSSFYSVRDKMPEKEEVKWGVKQRFEFIEWRAYWVGRINRGDLEDRFNVSTPQASLDLRAYQEAAPGNIEYDGTQRTYLPTSKFEPKFLRLSADRYLIQLDAILNQAVAPNATWFGSAPPATVMPKIVRSIEPDILQAILRCIEQRLELHIGYLSLTKTAQRTIVPHSLAFDGHRWHARAWCVRNHEFRDFVLSRILKIEVGQPSDADPTNDVEWNRLIDLVITPHNKLDDHQKAAIERDYGMRDGRLVINTRAALSFYLIKRLNLDLTDEIMKPERKQISLENLDEVQRAVREAKEEAKRRVAGSKVV